MQIFNFISSYEIPNSLAFYSHREILPYLCIFILPFNLLLGTACAGVAFMFRHRGMLLVLLLILGYSGSMVFFNMFYRFRIPVVPLVCLLAGGGFAAIAKAFKLKRFAQGSVAIFLIGGFFFATYVSPGQRREPHERRAVAAYFINKGRYAAAESYIDKLHKDGVDTRKLEHHLIKTMLKNNERNWAKLLLEKWKPFILKTTDKTLNGNTVH